MGKKKLEPITDPDVTNTDPAYWEQVLESHGLGMLRGRSPKSIYVGNTKELTPIEEKAYRDFIGKVEPPGHGPYDSES